MDPELVERLREVDLLPYELDDEAQDAMLLFCAMTGTPNDSIEFEKVYLPGAPEWAAQRGEQIYNLATALSQMEEGEKDYRNIEGQLWKELDEYENPGWTESYGFNNDPLSAADPAQMRRSLIDIAYNMMCTSYSDLGEMISDIGGDVIMIATETHNSPSSRPAYTGTGGPVRDPWVMDPDPELQEQYRRALAEGGALGDIPVYDAGAGGLFYDTVDENGEPRQPFVICGILDITLMDAPGPIDPTRFEGLGGTSLSKEDIRRAYQQDQTPPATGSSQTE